MQAVMSPRYGVGTLAPSKATTTRPLASAAPARPGGCSPLGAGWRRRAAAKQVRAFHEEEQGGSPLSADRRRRILADTSYEEAYLPSDADSDVPMNQRLAAGDLYREMAHLPPEYPPEPEVDSPDKHLRVADLASEEEEMLPDDPLDLDEELITDTKPFIADVYNEMPGVVRRATTDDIARHSSGGPAASNMPPDSASHMSAGEAKPEGREHRKAEAEADVMHIKQGGGVKGHAAQPSPSSTTVMREPEGRERRMAEEEAEVMDMKRGPGEEQAAQQASRGSSPAGGLSVEEAAAAAREGLKGAGAPTMQPQVQGQGVQGQSDEQRRGGSS